MTGSRIRLPAGLLEQKSLLQVDPKGPFPAAFSRLISIATTGAPCGASETSLQAYQLTIAEPSSPGQAPIRIIAATPAGIRHALATLAQLVRQYGDSLATMEIDDEPTFATRGLMLDVSRDRVPTMSHLFETVDLLASLKMNHLQVYTEHTFAYASHEEAWRGWSPITPDEIRELDRYCRSRGVELAANQNCFGHLAAWLKLPKYAHLAETHGDWVFDVWPRSGPFSICPTDPASLRFIEDLLGQLLPCFTSNLVNIGCDETYDIAYGRSKDEVQKRGRGAVYLEFVRRVTEVARSHGKRSMFWGDIALSHPDCVKDIPADLITLAWGYEPDAPFEKWCRLVKDGSTTAGSREIWVCPGTSSWRSVTGRTSERKKNIQAAAAQGASGGATGFLLCDWGDTGHHQQWPIVLNALAHGAHASWNAMTAQTVDPAAASLHVMADETLALAPWLSELGNVDLRLRETCGKLSRPDLTVLRNQSALFIDMFKSLDEQRDIGDATEWRRIPDKVAEIASRVPSITDSQVQNELRHTLQVARFAAERGSLRRKPGGIPQQDRKRLRTMLGDIIEEHRRLWLLRSREGGLDHSCSFYEKIGDSLGASA